MANIGTLEGYMYLRNAWRIILANDINMNAEIVALKDRIQEHLFYVNPDQVNIGTTTQTLVRFEPDVITHTHITLGFTLNLNVAAATNLNINVKFDGVASTFIHGVNAGWNIIAFPYIIPSVGAGTHVIEITAGLNSGTATIQPGKLNVFVQAQSILGYSSLPPTLNILTEVLYSNSKCESCIDNVIIALVNDVTTEATQEVNYPDVNNNRVAETVSILLE